MGAMVSLTVGFARRDRELRQGNWEGTGRRDGLPHQELAGRTLGLLGYGGIGVEIAKRARAFEMRIHAVKATPKATNGGVQPDWLGGPHQLKSLLESSDYLVVCCPLTAGTRDLLNALTLSWLRVGAYLVNVARAEVIEETPLFEALKSRRIAAAALDVWRQYPENAQQPLLPSTLPFHELDNVLLTPHLSAWTESMLERRWRKIAANLDALAEKRELQNVVSVNSPVSV
jgi:phosphoglycerate dehydrogenase-like enzyme